MSLSVDFVKRPSVIETAVPHLVHDTSCVSLVFACGSIGDGEGGSASYTFL